MFKMTICDPPVKDVVAKGEIAREAVLPAFRDFPWASMLAKMKTAKEEDIHFSPSVGFTNCDDHHSIEISIVEDEKETVFYLFYGQSDDESPRLELLDQSAETTAEMLAAFADGHYDRVRERFKGAHAAGVHGSKPWWKFW